MNLKPADILEKIQNLEIKYRYCIFVGGLLFVALLNYFLIMSPVLQSSAKLGEDNKTLADNLTRARENIKKLDEYKTELTRIQADMKSDNLTVRSKDEISLIIEDIYRIAGKHQVTLNQVLPRTDSAEKLMKNEGGDYLALPVFIQANAGFHNLGKFLNDLEHERIYRKLKDFTLASDTKNPMVHGVDMTLKAFIRAEAEEKK